MDNEILCTRCNNLGFYAMVVNNSEQSMNMFCMCTAGKRLKTLTIEFRLSDLKSLAENMIPKITEAKNKLHAPDEAGKILAALVKDLEEVIKKTEDALHDL